MLELKRTTTVKFIDSSSVDDKLLIYKHLLYGSDGTCSATRNRATML
jgi:hypothetical protein